MPSPSARRPTGSPRSRDSQRLGCADYQLSSRSIDRSDARIRFIKAAFALTPDLKTSLESGPYAAFLRALGEEYDDDWAGTGYREWSHSEWGLHQGVHSFDRADLPWIHEFHDALVEWCRRWNLDEPWVVEMVLASFNAWSNDEEQRPGDLVLGDVDRGVHGLDWLPIPPFAYTHPEGWDARTVPVSRLRRELRAAVDQEIGRYIADIEQRYGLVKTNTVRDDVHFRWAARYQVLEQSIDAISEVEHREHFADNANGYPDRSTVRDGIDKVMPMIMVARPKGRRRRTVG